MAFGGIVAAFHAPGPRAGSHFQHFAAGVVFSAVAVELLPNVVHERAPIAAVIGFAAGVALMLLIRRFTAEKVGNPALAELSASKLRLVLTVGVDLTIDGLLIGIGFAAGARSGILLTFALTMEVLFLGLATSVGMIKARYSRGRLITTIIALSLLLPIGAAIGAGMLSGLHGARLELALSFGCAALLYLVTEELLVEAHEVPETSLSTAMFFAGFLALLVIDMLAPATSG